MALVALHLLPAPLAWIATSTLAKGSVPVEACVLAGIPLVVVMAVAWVGYPKALTHPVATVENRVFVQLILFVVLAWTAIWIAGRPLPEDRVAAIQWARDGSYDNIRAWMEPLRAPWLDQESISFDDPG